MKKLLYTLVLTFGLSSNLHSVDCSAQKSRSISKEQLQISAAELAIFNIIANAWNRFAIKNSNSVLYNTGIGSGSWLGAQTLEAIYKSGYKKWSGRSLRDALGKTRIGSLEIDNQRAIRRFVTLVLIYLLSYPDGKKDQPMVLNTSGLGFGLKSDEDEQEESAAN